MATAVLKFPKIARCGRCLRPSTSEAHYCATCLRAYWRGEIGFTRKQVASLPRLLGRPK